MHTHQSVVYSFTFSCLSLELHSSCMKFSQLCFHTAQTHPRNQCQLQVWLTVPPLPFNLLLLLFSCWFGCSLLSLFLWHAFLTSIFFHSFDIYHASPVLCPLFLLCHHHFIRSFKMINHVFSFYTPCFPSWSNLMYNLIGFESAVLVFLYLFLKKIINDGAYYLLSLCRPPVCVIVFKN